MKKTFIFITFTVFFFHIHHGQKASKQSEESLKIPMKAAQWSYQTDQVKFISHLGVDALQSVSPDSPVILKDHIFKDGTISFDVALVEGGFVSLYFRRADADETECFYLRTYRAGDPQGWDAIQYAPFIKGINLWDMLPQYQSSAIIHAEGWNHIELRISGKQMLVYVNDMAHPALVIPHLAGNTEQGQLAFEGKAIFANLEIKHNDVGDLSPASGFDQTANDVRYLRNWHISDPVEFPFGKDILNEDLPTDSSNWQAIRAEREGLVNLTRRFGGSKNRDQRRISWLRTTIESKAFQIRKLNLGFSDEVWVILNGQLLYIDKNNYFNLTKKQPGGRCSVENASFDLPLREGPNELLIGLSNFFYGWGLVARLDMVEGLILEEANDR